MSLERYFF